jgi:hypothetical protein
MSADSKNFTENINLVLGNSNWANISRAVDDLKLAEAESQRQNGQLKFLDDVLKKETHLLYNAQMSLEAAQYATNPKQLKSAQDLVANREAIVQGVKEKITKIREPISIARKNVKMAAIRATENIPRITLPVVINELEKALDTFNRVEDMFNYESKVNKALMEAGKDIQGNWFSYDHPGRSLRESFSNLIKHLKEAITKRDEFNKTMEEAAANAKEETRDVI